MLKTFIKSLLGKLPYIRTLDREIKSVNSEILKYKTDHEPGHFYSPIVSTVKVKEREKEIFFRGGKTISGIDLNEDGQLKLLNLLQENYKTVPFQFDKSEDLRYYFDNTYYCYSDAIFLHLMIRFHKPKNIIEVGSGFSSAVMLDTNELFADNQIKITFIEPYPDRLHSLLKQSDLDRIKILEKGVEEIDLSLFDKLESNDILFIDSTHVSKTGSDVNKIIFEILPRLKKDVLVHFHDIFYPFEYPKEWVLDWNGFGWNESYLLKAFLMYNKEFEIVMFNTYLENFHKEWFEKNMPNCLKNEGGSLWIKKI